MSHERHVLTGADDRDFVDNAKLRESGQDFVRQTVQFDFFQWVVGRHSCPFILKETSSASVTAHGILSSRQKQKPKLRPRNQSLTMPVSPPR